MNLSDVTIGITAFLRPGYLRNAIETVGVSFPECELAIADDSGYPYAGHPGNWKTSIVLPFDSGLCKKRNALVAATDTKYLLLGSDDFVFDKEARKGVEAMLLVLKTDPTIDVACGRVNNKPYEGFLEYVPGSHIRETRFELETKFGLTNDSRVWYDVDITANYFLARTETIVPWQDELKIGGEHALWFLRMGQAGRRFVWVPGVNINTATGLEQDSRYIGFRRRAFDGHNRMKQILDIKDYIDFNGHKS